MVAPVAPAAQRMFLTRKMKMRAPDNRGPLILRGPPNVARAVAHRPIATVAHEMARVAHGPESGPHLRPRVPLKRIGKNALRITGAIWATNPHSRGWRRAQ